MANQYADNFKIILEARHKKPLGDILRGYADKGLTCLEVMTITGFKEGTVRKWTKRIGVRLKPAMINQKDDEAIAQQTFFESLKMSQINTLNVLSKRWVA